MASIHATTLALSPNHQHLPMSSFISPRTPPISLTNATVRDISNLLTVAGKIVSAVSGPIRELPASNTVQSYISFASFLRGARTNGFLGFSTKTCTLTSTQLAALYLNSSHFIQIPLQAWFRALIERFATAFAGAAVDPRDVILPSTVADSGVPSLHRSTYYA